MDTTTPAPWAQPFLIGGFATGSNAFAADPTLEATIYADERLAAGPRGVLVALLSYPTGSTADYTSLVHSTPEVAQEALRELYEAGYLRTHKRVVSLVGTSIGATLYGRTALAEAVAGAQAVRVVGKEELLDYVREAASQAKGKRLIVELGSGTPILAEDGSEFEPLELLGIYSEAAGLEKPVFAEA